MNDRSMVIVTIIIGICCGALFFIGFQLINARDDYEGLNIGDYINPHDYDSGIKWVTVRSSDTDYKLLYITRNKVEKEISRYIVTYKDTIIGVSAIFSIYDPELFESFSPNENIIN